MDTDQAAADYGDELDDLYNTDADGPSKNTARGRLPTFFGVQLAGQRQQPRKRQYLVHCSKQGTFEILSMPERQVLFQNHSLRYLPNVLHFATSRPEPQDPLEDSEVEQICLFDLGKERPLPALAVCCLISNHVCLCCWLKRSFL